MKSKGQKSVFNFITAVAYKFVVIAVGLILPKLFITNYGSELNGLRDSVRQIFTYIALLEGGIGAATLQSLYKPVAEEDNGKTNSYLSAASAYYNKIGIIYFAALAALGTVYALAVSVDSATKLEVFMYFLVSGSLTGVNFFYLAKLKLLISAKGDQYIVSIITMVTYTVSSLAKIILVYCGVHIIAVEAAYLVINLGATAVYYLFAKKKYPWISFREKPDYTCTKQKSAVLIHKITSVIFQNTDIVLLTFFCKLEAVSIYAMYKMVIDMVSSVITEIGNSVNFVLGQKFNSDDKNKEGFCAIIDVYNVYYSAVAFSLYMVAYIMMLPFLRIYTAGMDIKYIFEAMPLLYIAMEFFMVGREAMMRTIDVAGHFQKTQWRALIEAVINIVVSICCIICGKHFWGDIGGVYGVILGTVVALVYRTIDMNLYANKHILNRSPRKTFAIMATNAVLLATVVLIMNFVSFELSSYLELILFGLIVTPLMLLLFICVHSLIHFNEFKILRSYVAKRVAHSRV